MNECVRVFYLSDVMAVEEVTCGSAHPDRFLPQTSGNPFRFGVYHHKKT